MLSGGTRFSISRPAFAVLLLALASCSGGETTDPAIATTITLNSPAAVAGVAGAIVTPAPSVIVKDQNESPMGGARVTFLVVSGGGSVSGGTVTTDDSGVATVGSWTLGPGVGENALRATSGSLEGVLFTATSIAGPPASIARNAGDNQSGPAGTTVPIPPSVLVKDANGNPKPDVAVTFAVVSGGGSITGATVTSNGSGVATVGSWTLGPGAGENVLRATSGTLESVTFTATSLAGAAASITKTAGDNQTATVGTTVPVPPSVLVRDSNGNPRPGASVTFTIVSGGGSVTGATATSNASGIATVGSWTLGPAAGQNVLRAASGTLESVLFTATSVAGSAASIEKNAGDNQSALAGTPVPIPPSVIVKDANGNPKAGVSVTFAVVSGGGSITGPTAVTNSSGVAAVGSWTLGSSTGANSLSATSAGLPQLTFTATATSSFCTNARATHTFGTSSGGTLSSTDCQFPDGSFVDFHNTSVPQAGAYFFRQSAAFDTYLLLAMPNGATIGENDDELETGTNSGIKALLPAGEYLLGPGSLEPGVTGDYTISSTTAPTDVANCETVFVVRNITTTQNLAATDCNAGSPATPVYSDLFFIFLNAGASVTINMTSATLDSFVQLTRLDGLVVAENDDASGTTKDARVTFTAAQTNYYAIFTRSVQATATGAYTLTVQ